MSKLDPKPQNKGSLYSWKELNRTLQLNSEVPGDEGLLIDLRQFSLTKEEIIIEAEKQGYKVEERREHFLRLS
ncbi:hypothetical protein [Halalkalibacter hemicellulosilyticus]|uniref:Uncharacterized protein n=1 Tax=Halalkalibacter hemicellulosilyticusJCM 9152 TaxID=1236971 RepID=W4QLE7_9BACI|nr:hypothetical protein [Halalkalibacter hemicellulosilyticus]GAE32453.1 hypothetical protein JCM9152_3988 [Halalkalibacter hemicellulosilyticusJCM 9152]